MVQKNHPGNEYIPFLKALLKMISLWLVGGIWTCLLEGSYKKESGVKNTHQQKHLWWVRIGMFIFASAYLASAH